MNIVPLVVVFTLVIGAVFVGFKLLSTHDKTQGIWGLGLLVLAVIVTLSLVETYTEVSNPFNGPVADDIPQDTARPEKAREPRLREPVEANPNVEDEAAEHRRRLDEWGREVELREER